MTKFAGKHKFNRLTLDLHKSSCLVYSFDYFLIHHLTYSWGTQKNHCHAMVHVINPNYGKRACRTCRDYQSQEAIIVCQHELSVRT